MVIDYWIDAILVPQGAEYQAVCQGLKKLSSPIPQVLPIPIGSSSVITYLRNWQQSQTFLHQPPATVLLIGLCGSLSPQYQVGDCVIYEGCSYFSDQFNSRESWQNCDLHLTDLLQKHLGDKVSKVKGLTSDRLIWSAAEKLQLGKQYLMDVVDMEGYGVLKKLNKNGIKVAIIRVISDNCDCDLPNLTEAISSDGSLRPFTLTGKMLQQPVAAIRLIRGSLTALNRLKKLTTNLKFSH
jgi:hypothetical protein